jgi:hypothetical protein
MADNICMHPQGFNENSRLRASDTDRDTAATVINNALAEGRLTAEEHSDRLDAIYSAKTHADLVPLLEDLPATGQAAAPAAARVAGRTAQSGRAARIVAILGGASRKGAWHADPVINVLTVMGGAELDFREAILPGSEVVLRAVSVMGGVEIIIPPEMRVIDNGIAILGGRDIAGQSAESARPDAPVLRIEGACLLGGLEVKRRARRGQGGDGDAADPASLPGARNLDSLSQFREQRRELHQQRREMYHQIHQRRREMRWSRTDDTDDR